MKHVDADEWGAYKQVLQAIGETGYPLSAEAIVKGCDMLGVTVRETTVLALSFLLREAGIVHVHFEVSHSCSTQPLFSRRFSDGYVPRMDKCPECGVVAGNEFTYDLMIGWPARPSPMMLIRELQKQVAELELQRANLWQLSR